ncbi:MAG: hypothetical protein AAFY82_00070 [Pseudomonadota bacterium]
MLLSSRLGIVAALGAAAAIASASAFAYTHGKTIGQGNALSDLERISDNYIALVINEKIEKFAEIGYERQRAREALETAEAALQAGDRARSQNRVELSRAIAQRRAAEAETAEVLNNLERMRHDWANQRVPNEFVCGVYRGVRDIPGCADITAAAAGADSDNGVGVRGSEPASDWDGG